MSAWTGDLDETVVNLSLGIRMPDLADPDDLSTFVSALGHADKLGAIIVAAAGNDSPGEDKKGNTVDPMHMQVPAVYNPVLGVAATNSEGKRSCYSNTGEVAAPGGDGERVYETKSDGTTVVKSCLSRASTWNKPPGPNGPSECKDMGQCSYILISLGQTENGPQYIYWSGTSFATPLVSGLAALAYEEGKKSQVNCLIEKGASPPPTGAEGLGMGIINIANTFSPAIMQQCP